MKATKNCRVHYWNEIQIIDMLSKWQYNTRMFQVISPTEVFYEQIDST